MTDNEAIEKATEKLGSLCYLSETITNPGLRKVYDNMAEWLSKVVYLARIGLKGQQEQERNEPLTLDELREMDGEPVLLETGEVSIREQLIAAWEILIDHDEDCFFFTRRKRGFSAKNYGLTWLAYRRKPEEAQT